MGITVFRTGGAKRLFMPSMGISVVEPIGGAAPAWVPTDIPGCVLWLDASAITGLVDGDPVGTWSDLSGNLHHAAQTTTSKKPTYKTGIQNSLPVARFDGGDSMTGALGAFAAPCTIFLVVGLGAAVGYEYIVNIGAGSPRPVNMSISQLNGVSQPYYCFDGTAGYSGPVLTDSAWTILAAKHASSATFHYLWKDGAGQVVADYPQALSTNGNYVLGGYAGEILNFTGDVAEVLVYNTALSDTNRGLLEDYLGAKWGITVA